MANTKRYREFIATTLKKEGPLAAIEILDRCRTHFKFAPTMHSLGNILGKNPKEFHKHGFERIRGDRTSRLTMVWAHTSFYSELAKNEEE